MSVSLSSSLRKQGPITTGGRSDERCLTPCPTDTARRMGPCFRRDDVLRERQITMSSSGLTGRSSTPRRLDSNSKPLEYWIPAFAGMTSGGPDDVVKQRRPRRTQPSSSGLAGRSSTPRQGGDGMSAKSLASSLRTQGPITTGVRSDQRCLTPCLTETARRMGPCVRRDDVLRERQITMSSSGLTGRSSTPRPLVSISLPLEYWIPAFAGMTSGGRDDENRNLCPC